GEPVLDDQQHGQQHDGHHDHGGGHFTAIAAQPSGQGDGTLLALAVILAAMIPPAAIAATTRMTISAVVAVISPRSSWRAARSRSPIASVVCHHSVSRWITANANNVPSP